MTKTAPSVPYGRSVMASPRLEFLMGLCRATLQRLSGNVLEVGVYRGGSLLQLALIAQTVRPECQVFGVDTFQGHPYGDGHPSHPAGKYNDSAPAAVLAKLEQDGLHNVTLHAGLVEEVSASLSLEPLAFVHVDCDLYVPVKFCIEQLFPRLQPGGMMAFDDYLHPTCPGATRAIQERWPADGKALRFFSATIKDEHGAYLLKESA